MSAREAETLGRQMRVSVMMPTEYIRLILQELWEPLVTGIGDFVGLRNGMFCHRRRRGRAQTCSDGFWQRGRAWRWPAGWRAHPAYIMAPWRLRRRRRRGVRVHLKTKELLCLRPLYQPLDLWLAMCRGRAAGLWWSILCGRLGCVGCCLNVEAQLRHDESDAPLIDTGLQPPIGVPSSRGRRNQHNLILIYLESISLELFQSLNPVQTGFQPQLSLDVGADLEPHIISRWTMPTEATSRWWHRDGRENCLHHSYFLFPPPTPD
jgi:hypothetical protein